MTALVTDAHRELATELLRVWTESDSPQPTITFISQAIADAESRGREQGIREVIALLGPETKLIRGTETVRSAVLALLPAEEVKP